MAIPGENKFDWTTFFANIDSQGTVKLLQSLKSASGGPQITFSKVSDKVMDLVVNNPEKVLSALTFVTKNAKKYIRTPRKDGELAVLDTYIIDDVNYETEEYDAFKGGLVVFDPDPSSDTTYHIQIEFSSTFAKSGGIPLWVSLLWRTDESNAGLPPIITQPPAVSGVNTTDLNSYSIGDASVDTMDFPNVVEVPPAPSANTYEVFYHDSYGSQGITVVSATGYTTSIILRASKFVPSNMTIRGMLFVVVEEDKNLTISPGTVSLLEDIPYDGSHYRVYRFECTTSGNVNPGQTILTFTCNSRFLVKQYVAYTTSPIQVL